MCGGNSIIAEYLISMKTNNQSYNKIACYMNKGLDPLNRNKTERLFIEAEERRSILTRSGQLCPQFIEKHPGAIYTSRSLNSFISQLLNRPQHDLNLVNLDKWDSSDWDV
ncbi:20857_t:CDS:2 [Rhizophagus irregularis]|nr:20857_t:CDS:2 [Rhizophagus irregularis]